MAARMINGRGDVTGRGLLEAGVIGGLAAPTGAALLAGHGAWFDLANHLLLQISYATAGALAVLAMLAVLRGWRWRRRWVVPMAVVVAAQAAVLLPASGWHHAGAPAMARDAAATFRVIGFNLWLRNPAIDASIALLRREAADVVVLSEVSPGWRDALDRLADLYPYRVDCADEQRCEMVLLSRHPWQSARAWRGPGGTPLVEARIAIGGTDITVVGTHFARPFPDYARAGQQDQAAFLAAHLAAIEGPRVLIGDFNAAPWSPLIRTLGQDTAMTPLPGIDGTWPAALPQPLRVPIDLILVSREFATPARRVGPQAGSDHRPVIADIPLPAG